MRDTSESRTFLRRLGVVVGLSLFGLVGLPLVFGALPDPTQAILWLGLAMLVCACLIPALILLATPVSKVLLRLPVNGGLGLASARHATDNAARLTAGVVYLVLLQAILRHPLVAVFGASAEPFLIEGSLAVSIMIVLSIVIVWLHSSVAPLIEGLARTALDAALATSGVAEANASSRIHQSAAAPTELETEASQETMVTPGQSSKRVSTTVSGHRD